MSRLGLPFVMVACVAGLACQDPDTPERSTSTTPHGDPDMTMTLRSSDFDVRQPMPRRLTCEGKDLSPALAWSEAPPEAKSFALIVDDPDAPDPAAPKTTWVHWVLFNIPSGVTKLEAGAGSGGTLPEGARTGTNDWKRVRYGGPCPPIGRHRYVHKLYALDTTLDLDEPTKAELERAMEGHIVARAELVGTYQKGDP
jgi:Raf kinase inhibitor-like YbhB/YbcL family protein